MSDLWESDSDPEVEMDNYLDWLDAIDPAGIPNREKPIARLWELSIPPPFQEESDDEEEEHLCELNYLLAKMERRDTDV